MSQSSPTNLRLPQMPSTHPNFLHIFGTLPSPDSNSNHQTDIDLTVPVHLMQSTYSRDLGPNSHSINSLFVDYIHEKRHHVAASDCPPNVLGPDLIDFEAILEPSDIHPNMSIATWVANLFSKFQSMRPSDRIALAWSAGKMMRVSEV